MSFELPFLPERSSKPRTSGITMVMDKGLSTRGAEDLIETSGDLVDVVKLGFGTSVVSRNVREKVKLYRDNGIHVYVGGTLFEAFIIRDMFDEYRKLLDDLNLDMAEVSDGSIEMAHADKCEYISTLAKQVKVYSEVGSKEQGIMITPERWISMMNDELQAGSSKVIAEARESGNVGIYRPNGTAHTELINQILAQVPREDILWEAPQKSQQVWFIKLLGPAVNLGNIAPHEVIPLETLRMGLRGDTFFSFLPENLQKQS